MAHPNSLEDRTSDDRAKSGVFPISQDARGETHLQNNYYQLVVDHHLSSNPYDHSQNTAVHIFQTPETSAANTQEKHPDNTHFLDGFNTTIHNMRNSLAAVLAVAEVIEEEVRDGQCDQAKLVEHLGILMRSIRRSIDMTTLINSVICDRNGHFNIHKAIKNVNELMHEIAESYKNVQSFTMTGNVGNHNIDEKHFENVIRNIINNALKWAKGKITVLYWTDEINGDLIVTISDEGPGLGPNPDDFFDIYKRNNSQIKEFGLGLSYCKIICEKHGGSISARNNPEKGATFEIRIPCRSAHID